MLTILLFAIVCLYSIVPVNVRSSCQRICVIWQVPNFSTLWLVILLFVLVGFIKLSTLVVCRALSQQAASSKQGMCLPGSDATRQNLVPDSKTKDEITAVVVVGVVPAVECWFYSLLGWCMEPQPANAEKVKYFFVFSFKTILINRRYKYQISRTNRWQVSNKLRFRYW